MKHTHSTLSNLLCASTAIFVIVACAGSAPAPAAAEAQAVDSTSTANSSGDAAGTDVPAGNESKLAIRLSATGELLVNDVQIFEKGGVAKLLALMGPPTREKAYPKTEKGLLYDQYGLVFWTVDGEVAGAGVNFTWDGDDRFPETSFLGSVALGEFKVDRSTTREKFASFKAGSVSCFGKTEQEGMCAGGVERVRFLSGFVDGKVTQLIFLPPKE
jgi:hypothetical protein